MTDRRVWDAAARNQDKSLATPCRRFELLALPHLDPAHNLAHWLAGNTTNAEDVVEDAYTSLSLLILSKRGIFACGYSQLFATASYYG